MKLFLKILAQIPNSLEILSLKLEILQKYMGSLMFLPNSNLEVFDGCYFLWYCLEELKITQIAQVNELFQLLTLTFI